MKILVTGGLGFIGSHLIDMLLDKGNHVINIDCDYYNIGLKNLERSFNSERGFIENTIPKLRNININLCDKEELRQVFDESGQFDACLHLAAHSHVDTSIESPLLFNENVTGTLNLLNEWKNMCSEYGINPRFIYMSTDEVMGDLSYRDEKFKTKSPINPSSPYSASKASGELYARAFARTYGLDVSCIRSVNAYGPNQNVEKLIPKVITNALNDEKIPVYGGGHNIRDWIYVRDLVSAIVYFMEKSYSPPVINIGANDELSNIGLVHYILDQLSKPESLIEFVEDRPGHDFRYAIDTTDANNLGWFPQVCFEDGMKETINFYKGKIDEV